MEIQDIKTKLILAGIALIAIAAGAWYWYWFAGKSEPIKTAEDVVEAVTTPNLEVPSNPIQNKVPELNPIDRANPFKDAYKNPFEQ
ncbi:hypothetical protein A2661_01305 [Candidatus Giovannonibacteria bacterium RIFCSPHIGHO2_01_FULL_45_24]|uniref:Uncharacterized protein n=1 Tax=Candidatus Giovannonibacteria bacterium RIFCSPLOWO2_01_FULL_46_32 TaxID=1798353 RepID=A0A1F5XHA4_9BACT|nr:MAG: hypothetical protein A2661_01305 [Candidatus Giovannonibacteria bacterium RIFCSPHIGHO2_01_FULL_45_24]OGF87332.1 MAG: hypothetical protein A3B19_03900 [Candidatus Giovannonibacteria bacterium RIFCSPLOWO2_01_FULL_46_32]